MHFWVFFCGDRGLLLLLFVLFLLLLLLFLLVLCVCILVLICVCCFQAARELAAGTLKPKVKKVGLMQWALEKNPIGLNVLFKKTREMVAKQVRAHTLKAV